VSCGGFGWLFFGWLFIGDVVGVCCCGLCYLVAIIHLAFGWLVVLLFIIWIL